MSLRNDRIARQLLTVLALCALPATVLAVGSLTQYTFQCDGNCIGMTVTCVGSDKIAKCQAVAGSAPVTYECVCADVEEHEIDNPNPT